ncbi:MAG TPA: class A beta-lactamase-related serine hydrolase [Candidatus Aminicenantes bacterium]|nr:class A beta-lactamase-related serine hydrolase [Candidatus Aminicenantes bacterium]
MRPILGILCLAVLLPCASVAADNDTKEKAAVESLLSVWVDGDAKSPGIVAVLVDKEGARFYAHGCTQKEGLLVTADTHFEIGSLTKVFTALLMCRMQDVGVIGTDATVQTYLPADVVLPRPHEEPVTLLHLAIHSSGLPRMPYNFMPADHLNPYAAYTAENLNEFLKIFEPINAPGTTYAYSNAGFGLLGLLLERVGGKNYQALLDHYVLGPLEMKHTRMQLTEAEINSMAKPHDDKGIPVPVWDFKSLYAAGALKSNARDLARFLACQLGTLPHDMGKTFQRMIRPVLPLEKGKDANFMAVGWHILNFGDGLDCVAHDGGTGGTRSILLFNPEQSWGVAVLANSTHNCTPVALDIIRAVWLKKVDEKM